LRSFPSGLSIADNKSTRKKKTPNNNNNSQASTSIVSNNSDIQVVGVYEYPIQFQNQKSRTKKIYKKYKK